MNIAVIGTGRFGKNYLRTLNSLGINISWACSRTKKTIEDALKLTNVGAKITTDYHDVLKDKKTDAVIIATSGSTHYDIAKDCLNSGKHVLVEKPVCLSSGNVEELIGISKKRGLVAMAGHLHLFNPGIKRIKKDLALLGNVRYVQMFHTGDGPIRKDISALWDFSPHFLSILDYLFEFSPIQTNYFGSSYLNTGVDDVFTLDIKNKDNMAAFLFASWIHPLKQMKIILYGEKGYFVFDDYAEEKLTYYFDKEKRDVVLDDKMPLTEQVRFFIECVKKDKNPGLNNLQDALKIVEIIEKSHN